MDQPEQKKSPPESYVRLTQATLRLAAIRVGRADQFEALFRRLSRGHALSLNKLSRWSGVGERRLRLLKEGDTPKPGELQILEQLADVVDRGATLEAASRTVIQPPPPAEAHI